MDGRAAPITRAREPSKFDFADLFSEFIIGTWRHDPRQDNSESDTIDLNAEIIFRKLRLFDVANPIADFIFSPRPLIGELINNKNKTHTVYAALNWRHIFPATSSSPAHSVLPITPEICIVRHASAHQARAATCLVTGPSTTTTTA